jgi:putative intracellular protease/amidase
MEGSSIVKKRILLPLPDHDFDPTEVSIPWKALRAAGHDVIVSTEAGLVPEADPLMISGVLFGMVKAQPDAVAAYRELQQDDHFQHPIPYHAIDPDEYDALLLPGGHAPGMKQYLESETLRTKILPFMKENKPVAAICHGGIALARTLDPDTGKSVVYGRKMTSLLKSLERIGYMMTRLTRGSYFKTYPEYVENEIKRYLKEDSDFISGGSSRTPFCHQDGNLITARWPQDAHRFAEAFVKYMQ